MSIDHDSVFALSGGPIGPTRLHHVDLWSGSVRWSKELDERPAPGHTPLLAAHVVAVPTPEAVGTTLSAIIGVSVNLGRMNAVSKTLASAPEVRYLGLSTGRYDLILEAFFGSSEHLLTFVSERLGGLDGVTRVETSIILRVDKFSYEWELPLDP